jgi:hypothetical protein
MGKIPAFIYLAEKQGNLHSILLVRYKPSG